MSGPTHARHEWAQKRLVLALESQGWIVISASTMSPCDFIAFDETRGKYPRTLVVEVKTGESDLSPFQRQLRDAMPGCFVKAHWHPGHGGPHPTPGEWKMSGLQGEVLSRAVKDFEELAKRAGMAQEPEPSDDETGSRTRGT